LLRRNRGRLKHGNCRRSLCRRSFGSLGRSGCTSDRARRMPCRSEQRTPDRRPPVELFLQLRHAAEFFERAAVICLQELLLLDGCDVLDGDFYAIDRGENRSAHFLERLAEILDLTERPHEQLVKLLSERRVVGG